MLNRTSKSTRGTEPHSCRAGENHPKFASDSDTELPLHRSDAKIELFQCVQGCH